DTSTREHSREPEIRVRAHVEAGVLTALTRDLAGLRARCEQALAIPIPRLVLEPLGATAGATAGLALAPHELELRVGERVLGRTQTHRDRDALVLGCFHVLMDKAERLVSLELIETELDAVRRRAPNLV